MSLQGGGRRACPGDNHPHRRTSRERHLPLSSVLVFPDTGRFYHPRQCMPPLPSPAPPLPALPPFPEPPAFPPWFPPAFPPLPAWPPLF
jgi:hypothetical protein